MHNYRELKVWQRAMAFTIAIYRTTQSWPSDERFGLISQTRRATTSIALNIAEGSGNSAKNEFRRFLEYALRSTYEVMTAVEIARGLGYLLAPGCGRTSPASRRDCRHAGRPDAFFEQARLAQGYNLLIAIWLLLSGDCDLKGASHAIAACPAWNVF
jgi:four helix bundle protein